jgi:hypothetical protein
LLVICPIRFVDGINGKKSSFEAGMGLGALAGLFALWQLTSNESEGAETKKEDEGALGELAV